MSVQQLSAAICEDDPVYLELLQKEILQIIPVSIQKFSSYQDLWDILKNGSCPFDIIFMDIELGEFSGIDLAEKISTLNPCTQIIFISQYLKYVSPVYHVAHTFFCNKPELKSWLKPAVTQALENIRQLSQQFLQTSWNKEVYTLLQQKILYMERTLRVTNIHMADRKTYFTSEKFSVLLKKLEPAFVQCHRSYIVNLNYVSEFNKFTLYLSNDKEIPVSRRQAEHVKKMLACL